MVHGASMVQDEDATMLRLSGKIFAMYLDVFALFLDVSGWVSGGRLSIVCLSAKSFFLCFLYCFESSGQQATIKQPATSKKLFLEIRICN